MNIYISLFYLLLFFLNNLVG